MQPTSRYPSIDFFRGLTIAAMLIVNTPGTWEHVFSPLRHAEWHGCTLTDMVFPAFLFIIGTSMWFSFEKYGRKMSVTLLMKIAKRAAVLILLGLVLSKFPFFWKNFDTWRLPGVLQRLGLCYALAALLVLLLPARGVVAVAVFILMGYGLALIWGAPHDPFGLSHNLVRQLDLAIFGENHLWKGKGIPFDPEGLLSTLPATVTVLMGWWSGQIVQKNSGDPTEILRKLLLFGVLTAAAGLLWHQWMPINKYLWTSSYVLYTGGLCAIFLAASVWLLDIRQRTGAASLFFTVFGANPLFAYVLAALTVKTLLSISWLDATRPGGKMNVYAWVFEHFFAPIEAGKVGSLLFALTFMLLIWLVCLAMWRRRVFIKI